MKMLKAILAALCVLFLVGCKPPTPSPNQQQGTLSPRKKYVLNVPIEQQTTDPAYKRTPVWKVTISDINGVVVYKDEKSTMVGNMNVYWGWDEKERVWLYNSDDGLIWRWEFTTNGWTKIQSQRSDGIPDWILPDYAKRR